MSRVSLGRNIISYHPPTSFKHPGRVLGDTQRLVTHFARAVDELAAEDLALLNSLVPLPRPPVRACYAGIAASTSPDPCAITSSLRSSV